MNRAPGRKRPIRRSKKARVRAVSGRARKRAKRRWGLGQLGLVTAPPAALKKLASLLRAVGHFERLQLLARIARLGESSHQILHRETRLAAGPLYFHLRPLVEMKLVVVPKRNTYRITPKGRNTTRRLGELAKSGIK